jgi:SAM-dependent methyltransferase
MRRFTDYDPFAWLYTNYWGEEFHREAIPVLERLLLHRVPAKAEILDLCCGDGRITQTLSRRGYKVSGLDGSERMLSYARQRSPRARFYLEDARRFRLPPRFDAVISTFDSLNHIMETDDLGKVFANAFQSLKPGGYFAFDLNREEAYRDMWSRTSTIVDKKAVSVARGRYDFETGIAICDVTLVRWVGEQWIRSDFRLKQRLHPRDAVMGALGAAGFQAQVFDAMRDLGMEGDIGYGRDFYLAAKPND